MTSVRGGGGSASSCPHHDREEEDSHGDGRVRWRWIQPRDGQDMG